MCVYTQKYKKREIIECNEHEMQIIPYLVFLLLLILYVPISAKKNESIRLRQYMQKLFWNEMLKDIVIAFFAYHYVGLEWKQIAFGVKWNDAIKRFKLIEKNI